MKQIFFLIFFLIKKKGVVTSDNNNMNNNRQNQTSHMNDIGTKYAKHVTNSKNSTRTFRSMLEEADMYPIDEA